uniref:Uncharacterized protein n=1 Tax=Micrurus corallinus TaxID=54390 RepID=A0A2D4EYN3_MICCO
MHDYYYIAFLSAPQKWPVMLLDLFKAAKIGAVSASSDSVTHRVPLKNDRAFFNFYAVSQFPMVQISFIGSSIVIKVLTSNRNEVLFYFYFIFKIYRPPNSLRTLGSLQ